MPSCLGMYVQDNLIKYAKVSKDHDKIKVDSFGVKFYENINEAIKQVVEETYSYKTPISINLEQPLIFFQKHLGCSLYLGKMHQILFLLLFVNLFYSIKQTYQNNCIFLVPNLY